MNAVSPPWLLALHSSSEVLGLGLAPLAPAPGTSSRISSHPLGRRLSNDLLACVELLLPAPQWRQLGRLAVATGPGGFTGTRVTVVFARTVAQQLGLPLDGFSSFLLMAHRLRQRAEVGDQPFWLLQELPRRGIVAGCYAVDEWALGGIAEREAPRLYAQLADLPAGVRLEARVDPEADVDQLLRLSGLAAAAGAAAPWASVLPLYPTSPVGQPLGQA
ncbi:MAG: tRNA (adenosine(37)-N6)-threonylcarbamoyltransferase complex dimerization subunit type 1 TsaB [Cyanobacteria bacterium]|nr:tRNA (adenosine(37)-N6)-threonylcarbamoyltransferase complex dimerization subunit type 1 TsaB [Cyanobacteriota bacterium]